MQVAAGLSDISAKLVDKVSLWIDTLVVMFPNLVVAVVVVTVGWGLGRLARRLVYGALERLHTPHSVNGLVSWLASIAVLSGGLMIALSILNLEKAATSLLAGAGIVGLALGFAFQDLAANFIAGVYLAVRFPFREGDLIETNDTLGIAERIRIRSTTIRTLEGQAVMIPNKEIFTTKLINYSETGARRVDLSVGVSYGDDLEKVRRVALDAARQVRGRDTTREVELFYDGFGDSAINLTVRIWIPFRHQDDYLGARSELLMHIKKAFDENDIAIPFPVRTLDFGIKGGVPLTEMAPRVRIVEDASASAPPGPAA
ncbi:mechanosensitive ion channel family protein [Sorangium sp. So ce1182]|uniref:mechanosensitive ion channel family protein n=1 Tax=Sorangium sp. So ce1182 TaxID=3133334 RepID=UPI003F60D015